MAGARRGKELTNRMDDPHVQPLVGVRKSFSGVQALLRRVLGETRR